LALLKTIQDIIPGYIGIYTKIIGSVIFLFPGQPDTYVICLAFLNNLFAAVKGWVINRLIPVRNIAGKLYKFKFP